MDAGLSTAARALSAFDPLSALNEVALRNDPPALALRGVAMAQLGEFTRARKLLTRAARAFGSEHPVAQARCRAAEAEVALACRDLNAAGPGLESAAKALEASGDANNALFIRVQLVRRLVLLGKVTEATRALGGLALKRAPARIVALAHLLEADVAVRGLRAGEAREALEKARAAARFAKIPSLHAEVERASRELAAPVARLRAAGTERPVSLEDVEALVHTGEVVVDACRREVRVGTKTVSLATRPVLFALAAQLGAAAPSPASREELIRHAFGGRAATESFRARLRVEIGRVRRALAAFVRIDAAEDGFVIAPRRASCVVVLSPPEPGDASAVLALLAGGESWSTSALAAALGQSQRTVQRALGSLLAAQRVRALGDGRSRRWAAPEPAGFATTLLLVARDARE